MKRITKAKMALLSKVILLALTLLVAACNSSEPAVPVAAIEAIATQAQSARTTAQAAESQVKELESIIEQNSKKMDEAITIAQTASTKASEAVTIAQTAVTEVSELKEVSIRSEVTPTPERTIQAEKGGVAIGYQNEAKDTMIFYAVDDPQNNLQVYADYAYSSFRASWNDTSPATVLLALIETSQNSGEFELYTAEPISDSNASTGAWYEYSSTLYLNPGQEGASTEETNLILGNKKEIIKITNFQVPQGSDSTQSFIELEIANTNTNLIRRLLLKDESGEETTYTLIVFEGPDSGAGGDRIRLWCSTCVEGPCNAICWWVD